MFARKLVLALVLFIVFSYFFGKPSFDEFLKHDVIVYSREEVEEGGMALPGVTICVLGTEFGWKKPVNVRLESYLLMQCGLTDNVTELTSCVEKYTFSLYCCPNP